MNLETFKCYGALILLNAALLDAAAPPFQNLNFESANLPVLPVGQPGGLVSVTDALPGWNAFLGTQLQSQVHHNEFAVGSSAITIRGPHFFSPIIEREFDLGLQAGRDPAGPGALDVSVSQSGFVPVDSLSIRFIAAPGVSFPGASGLRLELDDQNIPLQVLSTIGGYVEIGGDISAFAGQTANLEIIAIADLLRYNVVLLDAITFSPVPVPEPSTWALLGVGLLCFANYIRKRVRR